VRISAVGAPELGTLEVLADAQPVELAPVTTRSVTVRVRAQPRVARSSQAIEFVVSASEASAGTFEIREKSRFLVP
jgi:hypothetical protein